MSFDATVFAADIAGVESDEANLSTVVTVTLPDGIKTVVALRTGQNSEFDMMANGYMDRRGDTISIRRSLLVAHSITESAVRAWAKNSSVTIDGQSWQVDSVEVPDNAVYFLKLSQSI